MDEPKSTPAEGAGGGNRGFFALTIVVSFSVDLLFKIKIKKIADILKPET
jgi:hypothetical protein